MESLLSIREASVFASEYTGRDVSTSNISYLIQYGKVKKIEKNGSVLLVKNELKEYYDSYFGKRQLNWTEKLGNDINWHLSFDHLREKDTTKHVHRLHPYKGKFIPQLVEYFLDGHTDEFKNEVYFSKGDYVLDPFCGSGTTLVQANELGIHAIGVDISKFNSLITNAKLQEYNIYELNRTIKKITNSLTEFSYSRHIDNFEQELINELYLFNSQHFPSPQYRYDVNRGKINEYEFGSKREQEFKEIYYSLLEKHKISLEKNKLKNSFINKWYSEPIQNEIDFLFNQIKSIKDPKIKKILTVILSRTIRSCRATTHSDLATLKEPVYSAYYCTKHKKICKPLFTLRNWWNRYSTDTLNRLEEFKKYKTNTFQYCFQGDSTKIDINKSIEKINKEFSVRKFDGIFTSPPYVGLIDYHEQHEYAYELFGFQKNEESEIGSKKKGYSKNAQYEYVENISNVLLNCKDYLKVDFNIFIVANDKNNLYDTIVEKANMQIVKKYKRPVLNRTERDKNAYSEIIFHIKEK